MKKTFKFSAFTLAEVLITLGIIGIVAAYVIPSLMNKINDSELKVAWKKAYTEINQAIMLLANDNNESLVGVFGTTIDPNKFREVLLPYFRYSKICTSSDPNCTIVFKFLNNIPEKYSTFNDNNINQAGFYLSNGFFINIRFDSTNCSHSEDKYGACGLIRVDVNGKKPPNMVGKDIFGGNVTSNGMFRPFGAEGTYAYDNLDDQGCNTTAEHAGWACSAEYLYK